MSVIPYAPIVKFYPGWLYNALVTVTNPPLVTGYEVPLTVPWVPGTRDDFADLRFSDGIRTLPYCIESMTPRSSASVWVKFTEIGEAARMFYMYYGNGGAVSESNGDAVFYLYDHFESANSSKWSTETGTISNSVYQQQNGHQLVQNTTNYPRVGIGYAFRLRMKTLYRGGSHASDTMFQLLYTDAFNDRIDHIWASQDSNGEMLFYRHDATMGSSINWTANTWAIVETLRYSTSRVLTTKDGATLKDQTDPQYVPEAGLYFITNVGGADTDMSIDYFFIHKTQESAPTCTITRYGVNWVPQKYIEYQAGTVPVLSAAQHDTHIDLTWSLI